MSKQYVERLSLCQAICTETKRQVLASEDIISPQQLPYFLSRDKSKYIQKFGETAVSLYLQHIAYLKYVREAACEILRDTSYKQFTFDASKPYMSQNSTVNFEIPVMLGVAHYGVGACHELAISVLIKLLEQKCPATLIKFRGLSSEYGHCVVLVGDTKPSIGDCITSLNQYGNEIILIDPLIHYVGPANQYLNTQMAYLRHFDFYHLEDVTTITNDALPFYLILSDELKKRMASRLLRPFIFESNLPHETASLEKLNHLSSLKFLGHVDENFQVNAFCTIQDLADLQSACTLIRQLQAGLLMTFKSSAYLVFPGINMPSEKPHEPSLAQRIQRA